MTSVNPQRQPVGNLLTHHLLGLYLAISQLSGLFSDRWWTSGQLASALHLSLIHISEPTRPY